MRSYVPMVSLSWSLYPIVMLDWFALNPSANEMIGSNCAAIFPIKFKRGKGNKLRIFSPVLAVALVLLAELTVKADILIIEKRIMLQIRNVVIFRMGIEFHSSLM